MLNWAYLHLLRFNEIDSVPITVTEFKKFLESVIDKQYRTINNRYIKFSRFRNGKKIVEKLIPKNILESNEYFEKYRNYDEWIQELNLIEEYNKPSLETE